MISAEGIKALNRISYRQPGVVQTVDMVDEGEGARNALLAEMQREDYTVVSLHFYTNENGVRMLTIVYR